MRRQVNQQAREAAPPPTHTRPVVTGDESAANRSRGANNSNLRPDDDRSGTQPDTQPDFYDTQEERIINEAMQDMAAISTQYNNDHGAGDEGEEEWMEVNSHDGYDDGEPAGGTYDGMYAPAQAALKRVQTHGGDADILQAQLEELRIASMP